MAKIKSIKNSEQHKLALKRIEELFDAELGTEDGNELEDLVTLVHEYEDTNVQIDTPDPVEAIKFRKEQERSKEK